MPRRRQTLPLVALAVLLVGGCDPMRLYYGEREVVLSDSPALISAEAREFAPDGSLPVRSVDSGVCFLLGTVPSLDPVHADRLFFERLGSRHVCDSPIEVFALTAEGDSYRLSRCIRSAALVRTGREEATIHSCHYLPDSEEPPRAVARVTASSSVLFLAEAVEWRTSRRQFGPP